MKKCLSLICLLAMTVFAAGCVRSVHPAFGKSDAVSLLPANAVVVEGNGTVYKLHARGVGYEFEEGYSGEDGEYRGGIFTRLDGSHYVAQILTKDKGYYYALAMKEGNALVIHTPPIKKILESGNVRVTKQLSSSQVQIEGAEQMRRFYTVALRYLEQDSKSTYRIFDYDDPAQKSEADKFIAAHDKKQGGGKAKQTAQAANTPAPSSAGSWSLVEKTDPMTDAKITQIVGKPHSYEGMEVPPYMQVSCGKDGLGFTVYWGARMEDLYPAGDMDAVGVDVRFDKNEPMRLGWGVSSDWTKTYNMNALAAGIGQMGQSMIDAFLPGKKVVLAWDERVFHLNMKNAKSLILRAATRGGNWAIMEFDMNGYSDLAQAFPGRCG